MVSYELYGNCAVFWYLNFLCNMPSVISQRDVQVKYQFHLDCLHLFTGLWIAYVELLCHELYTKIFHIFLQVDFAHLCHTWCVLCLQPYSRWGSDFLQSSSNSWSQRVIYRTINTCLWTSSLWFVFRSRDSLVRGKLKMLVVPWISVRNWCVF